MVPFCPSNYPPSVPERGKRWMSNFATLPVLGVDAAEGAAHATERVNVDEGDLRGV